MRRPLRPEEVKLWSMVVDTVEPRPGRVRPEAPEEPAATVPPPANAAKTAKTVAPAPVRQAPRISYPPVVGGIEPNRSRRIALGREAFGGRLDLHGYTQDQARAALTHFILRAHDEGARAVLVITGKGSSGGGVLRRMVPEWLNEGPLRHVVAGLSAAQHRHGGDGAMYVALKKRRD
jgi:DNA-nicking Smr family endonuclease